MADSVASAYLTVKLEVRKKRDFRLSEGLPAAESLSSLHFFFFPLLPPPFLPPPFLPPPLAALSAFFAAADMG